MFRLLIPAIIVVSWAAPSAAQDLNLSQDLVRLGVASANIEPNRPDLDARPLFQAAIDYVRQRVPHRIARHWSN